MRMRGMVLAGVAAAAILTACETSETGQAGDAELQTVTVTGSQQDSSAPPPPPPAPPPPQMVMESRAMLGKAMAAPVILAPAPEFRDQYEDVEAGLVSYCVDFDGNKLAETIRLSDLVEPGSRYEECLAYRL